MRKLYFLIPFFLWFILLAGCRPQKTIVTNYYLIELPDSVVKSNKKIVSPVDANCLIDEIKVHPAYSTMQIPLRTRSHEIRYYNYHEWAVRPNNIFREEILRYFEHSGLFNRVSTRFWQSDPLYTFQTAIYQLEVMEKDGDFYAHLNVVFRLLDNRTGTVVAAHSADVLQRVEKKDLNLVAGAMSQILAQELETVTVKIRQSLQKTPTD
jgi:ABC-type uncharacterized transport system auxiliary subunit